jgi:hypothetical protein
LRPSFLFVNYIELLRCVRSYIRYISTRLSLVTLVIRLAATPIPR